jgi:hypothetical protein
MTSDDRAWEIWRERGYAGSFAAAREVVSKAQPESLDTSYIGELQELVSKFRGYAARWRSFDLSEKARSDRLSQVYIAAQADTPKVAATAQFHIYCEDRHHEERLARPAWTQLSPRAMSHAWSAVARQLELAIESTEFPLAGTPGQERA